MTTSNILSQLGSPGVSTGMKNRIINGSMVINQRNGSPYTVSGGGAVYTVDRFYGQATSGSFTVTQSSTAPTGFNNSLLVNVTSAVTSPASTDVFVVSQIIEGYNIADLQEGTANGKSFTISFWVKSNLTGTFCVGVRSSSGDYGYAATYTISSANTWQFVSVTIPPTTSGTWVTNNTQGMYILFDMGSGSNRNITANTWTAGSGFNTSSQTNVMASTSNNFAITGVQLEVGTNATNFEYLDYGRSLIQCQRYYELVGNGATGSASTNTSAQAIPYKFCVAKRTPNVSLTHLANYVLIIAGQATFTATGTVLVYASINGCLTNATVSTTPSSTGLAITYNQTIDSIAISAEL